jgi:predicted nucleic acid-binding protein
VIFVDTSVWVAALRSATGVEAENLRRLLDLDAVALAAPVRVEILAGASTGDRARLRRLLSAIPTFYPTAATWERVESWLDRAAAGGPGGQCFGFADLVIGALAVEHGGRLWSLDSDFRRMARLDLVELFVPVSSGA